MILQINEFTLNNKERVDSEYYLYLYVIAEKLIVDILLKYNECQFKQIFSDFYE